MKSLTVANSKWIRAAAIAAVTGTSLLFVDNTRSEKFSSETSYVRQESLTAQQPSGSSGEQTPAQKYFTDVELTNQNGQKMRFYSDLLKGKVVVINSFFATCPGSCLSLTRNMQKVQEGLGNRVGKDVYLISISVDPMVDTPAKLREFAKKVDAKPGWFFLTGEKANVDLTLRKLGQYVEKKEEHLNIFIIGNERTGLWKKAFGLARSDELIKVVESVLNDQPTGGN